MERFLDILKTPSWQRTLLLRRLGACLLVVLAGVAALRQARPSGESLVVISQRVTPGTTLSDDALELKLIPEDLAPDSAFRSREEAAGLMVATTLEPGEILTSHKVVAPSQQEPGHDLVPLTLANPDIIPVLRHGDIVSIIAADKSTASPEHPGITPDSQSEIARESGHPASEVIASNATVVVAAAQTDDSPETLLVELPHELAARVAAVGLNTQLTVVISGGRS